MSIAETLPITTAIDWQRWMQSWDAQQTGYLPDREARFDVMLDTLAMLLPEDFVALDLACGPGSISQRLLSRFPNAHSVAVDLDPLLITMGRGALGDQQGRLQWHEVDLRDADWHSVLGETKFHAVLSTTALHWLPTVDLMRVYRQVGIMTHPGGLFLNGDNMRFGPHLASFNKVADLQRKRTWDPETFAAKGIQNWEQWWDELKREPGLEAVLAERERRFNWRSPDNWLNPVYEMHEAALREAGFRKVGTLWQNVDNHLLMAVK